MVQITNNLLFKEAGFSEAGADGLEILANITSCNVTTNDNVTREQPSSGSRGVDYLEVAPYEGEVVIKGIKEFAYSKLKEFFTNNDRIDLYVSPKNTSIKDKSSIIYKFATIATLPLIVNFVGDSSTNDFVFTITGSSFDIVEKGAQGNVL